MVLLRRIYSIYGLIIFTLSFLILLPFFIITIEVPNWHKYGRRLNQVWAKIFFNLIFIRVKIENKEILKSNKQYVIVANHFSYLDIPVIGLISRDAIFVGKSSLGRLPLFGYMFRKLHIAVDRSSFRSRGETLRRTKEVIEKGFNIIIFPEGGIRTTQPPTMAAFKDGAFHIAQEKQIPVIPVTLSYNHLILPDDKKFLLNHKSVKVVIHPPLEVKNESKDAIAKVRDECFKTIQNQLWKDNGKPISQKGQRTQKSSTPGV
ncbi:lysophospholipid acyltransferase family protein [Echinicola jeungdonensis]|uniref:Lysophospholipid acyltransferase family protein n=1 Tax=Echinicola jeungdonensis TaxID=709343 RepID=A0ABV5J658_9BACT|nr:lysophospholipid acyltransferase family protein [Echinicola jeungdonensis]MDN3669885.1 lysophospholipid acyltransferase family protein [Echinicola jeungdonensis]